MGHTTAGCIGCYSLNKIVQACSRRSAAYRPTAPQKRSTAVSVLAKRQPTGEFTLEERSISGSESEDEQASTASQCENSDASTSYGQELCKSDDDFGDAPYAGEEFIEGLGKLLSRWSKENQVSGTRGRPKLNKVSCFQSVSAPKISIADYIKRIRKYFMCSNECFVLALVFIDRICQKHPYITMCSLTAHRLVMTAVLIAAKLHDDVYYSNKYYARVGGLSLEETNGLEAAMLDLLDWNISVSAEEYTHYHGLVSSRLKLRL